MTRAHVEIDGERIADIMIREFNVDHFSNDCEPEVTIVGSMIGLNEQKPQSPKLIGHQNCKCKWFSVFYPTDIKKVIFNDPATVIYWSDNTRTVVKCQPGDEFDPKLGFLMALCKKVCGNTGNYNDLLREYVPGYGEED